MSEQAKKQFCDMKAAIHAAFKRQEAAHLEAQRITLPADPLAELLLFEAEALTWPEHEKLPQKKAILNNIVRARRAYEKNDIPELKLEYFVMLKNRENAWSDYLQSYYNGKKSQPRKKQEWAIEAAKILLEKSSGKTEHQVWRKLPLSYQSTTQDKKPTFYLPECDCGIYRDGETIFAFVVVKGNSEKEEEIVGTLQREPFFKSYYRPAKNSGT